MSTLGQIGVQGMVAVNSWIGVINGNMIGASRTAYKAVRPVMLDSISTGNVGDRIQIPSATLRLQATSFEWNQGAVVKSNYSSHFAIQGQGFFVVADNFGRYYLTRDGEFHWDGNGYLVNSAGMRVVSSGQDFIRYSPGDESDMFHVDGQSRDLARYGDKSFLIVDVANRNGLRMSRYGSTIFEVDGKLPLRVVNDFSNTTDGLTFLYRDPKQLTYVDLPAAIFTLPAPGIDSDFEIDFGGGNAVTGPFSFFAQTGTEFNAATHTIQDVVNAVEAYALANQLDIRINFDHTTDRLMIENVPEPKVNNPNFSLGNFAIDFGDNGYFVYHDFQPGRVTIQNIVDRINQFAAQNGVNIVASFDSVTDTFTLTNTVGVGDNSIRFDGVNGPALADFFNLNIVTASTGAGALPIASATEIDRFPLDTAVPSADITANDVTNTFLADLIKPPSYIRFGGTNGTALERFFKLDYARADIAFGNGNTFVGTRMESREDIDNSSILDSADPNRHSLDIAQADLNTKPFLEYLTTSDTTYPLPDFAGPPANYSHNKSTGQVISDAGAIGHGMIAIGQAQKTDAFEVVLDYETSSEILEFHFGYQRQESIDSNGFSVYYNTITGTVELYKRGNNPNDVPVLMASAPAGSLPNSLNRPNSRLVATWSKNGDFTLSINGSAPVIFSAQADFNSAASAGHLSIGHQAGSLILNHLYADFKAAYNTGATGQLVSMGNVPYAAYEVNPSARHNGGLGIVQAALESSTSSLTEYLPLLSLAQKVFSSLSKVISTSIALQDDINSLLR